MYTIRLGVDRFKCSRTQKRVIAKMNEFLNTGQTSGGGGATGATQSGANQPEVKHQKKTSLDESLILSDDEEPSVEMERSERSKPASMPQKTPKRHAPTKKRQQRIERRLAKGKTFTRSTRDTPPKPLIDRLAKGIAISIENDNKKITISGQKNTLEIKLVKVNSDEEEASMAESHAIYKNYQRVIHDDKECDMKGWTRFLRKNPFQYEEEMGLYHCQYRLNDKLICVGVLDNLTECLSSVYLYFDTAYSYLNLGTYSACVEILLSQLIGRPYYYMGYYIHRLVLK